MNEETVGKVIDVDYEILSPDNDEEESKNKETDITINADPLSAFISGVCSIANSLTNAVKEYNICKQQEKTKRESIKAQMKVEIEKIDAQKKICLKLLDNQHEIEMQRMQEFYRKYKQALDNVSDAVHSAIEIAKESKNFSDVCTLLEYERQLLKESSEAELKEIYGTF